MIFSKEPGSAAICRGLSLGVYSNSDGMMMVYLLGVWRVAMGDSKLISKDVSPSTFCRCSRIFSFDFLSWCCSMISAFPSNSCCYNSRSISEKPRESSNSSSPLMYSILSITLDKNLIPPSLQSLYLSIKDHVQPMTYLLPTASSTRCKIY